MSPAVATGRTQEERRRSSEEALLDAAAELIAERGIDRASLASIGERAGSSRGLPTHHFGSKDRLVARLALRAQNQIDEDAWAGVRRDRVADETVTGLDRVRATLDAYLRRFEQPTADDRALIVMWGATFPAEAALSGMQEADRRSLDGWAGLIEQGQADGSVGSDLDPRTTAMLLHGLIRGVAAALLTDAELADRSRVRDACHEWVTAALERPSAALHLRAQRASH